MPDPEEVSRGLETWIKIPGRPVVALVGNANEPHGVSRRISDVDRTIEAIRRVDGRKLTYKQAG